jgi:hypothetical protein
MKGFEKDLTMTSIKDIIKLMYALFSGDASSKWRLTVKPYTKKRSLPANKVYQSWIPAISNEMALTIPEATRYIKLTFGLPILLADPYMGNLIGEGLAAKGFFQLSYEDQMVEMERLPVTRLFDTKMHNKLRDDLQHYFGSMGLNLEYRG